MRRGRKKLEIYQFHEIPYTVQQDFHARKQINRMCRRKKRVYL